MTIPMVRGYVLVQSLSFIESSYFDAQARRRIMDAVPSEVMKALPDLKPHQWYPRDTLIALQRAVAGSKDTEREIYDVLVAYGVHVCQEATNTFLRILLRLLTPGLFAKKIPDFWRRDHQGSGQFEVDVQRANEGIIKLRLVGAGGFDHIAIPSIGFVTHVLKGMGKSDVRMTQKGWSLATPAPNEVDYEILWA